MKIYPGFRRPELGKVKAFMLEFTELCNKYKIEVLDSKEENPICLVEFKEPFKIRYDFDEEYFLESDFYREKK